MNIIRILSAVSVFIIFFNLSAHAAGNDFNKVCGYFEELAKTKKVDSMTHLQRNDFILDKLNKNLQPSSDARITWEAVGNAESSQRYELYQSTAESVLNKKWQCQAMKTLAPKTGEF